MNHIWHRCCRRIFHSMYWKMQKMIATPVLGRPVPAMLLTHMLTFLKQSLELFSMSLLIPGLFVL